MPNFENLNELVKTPTDYTSNVAQDRNEIWQNAPIDTKLHMVDTLIVNYGNADQQEKLQEAREIKRDLLKYYFGMELDEDAFDTFEKNLEQDPQTKEAMDKLVDTSFSEVQGHEDTYKTALFGRKLFNESQKYNNLVGAPEAFRKTKGLLGAWEKAGLEGKLRNVDTAISEAYNMPNPEVLPEAIKIKKTLVTHLLGESMTDAEFSAFENAITQDQKKQELFSKIVNNVDVSVIYREKEVFTEALFGKELAQMRHEKDESVKVPTDEEVEASIKRADDVTMKGFYRTFRTNAMKSYLNTVRSGITETVKNSVATLRSAAPNPAANNGANLAMPFADKEKQQEEYYKAAANVIGSKLYQLKKDTEGLDLQSLVLEVQTRKDAISQLQQDPDFRCFVRGEIEKKNVEAFEPDALTQHWQNYRRDLFAAKDAYNNQIKTFRENPENVPEELAFFKTVNRAVPGNDQQGFEMVNVQKATHLTYEEAKSQAETLLNDARANGKEQVVEQKDFAKAANLIVANALTTKAAELTFFATKDFQNDKGECSIDQMNKSIVEMRNQVIEDPVFQRVLTQRVKESEIVSTYQNELKKEVNKKITKQATKESQLKKDAAALAAHEEYAKTHSVELTDKERNFIKDTLKNIKIYNKGKDPSDLMQKLTDALEGVDKVEGNKIPIDKMEALNKATLNYYKERQGRVFSPITKRGKARLGAVEKMAFVTDGVMDRAAKQEKAEMAKQQKVVKNEQAMVK